MCTNIHEKNSRNIKHRTMSISDSCSLGEIIEKNIIYNEKKSLDKSKLSQKNSTDSGFFDVKHREPSDISQTKENKSQALNLKNLHKNKVANNTSLLSNKYMTTDKKNYSGIHSNNSIQNQDFYVSKKELSDRSDD